MAKGLVMGIVVALLLGFGLWLGVVYTGAYNVAATDSHADLVRWSLATSMRRSVAARAEEDRAGLPERFAQETIASGAEHYAESCVLCHGAPGVEPEAWAQGMRPEPPDLTEAASEWSPDEIHWIVEHGIKMTGMPAFGPHHGDDEIVAITAFVSQLPGLTSADYAALTRATDRAESTENADSTENAESTETSPLSEANAPSSQSHED